MSTEEYLEKHPQMRPDNEIGKSIRQAKPKGEPASPPKRGDLAAINAQLSLRREELSRERDELAVEVGGLRETLSQQIERDMILISEARKQRDELLAACKAAEAILEEMSGHYYQQCDAGRVRGMASDALPGLRAAIAAEKGGK